MTQTLLDLDVLRSFVTGIQLGSYAKAADRLGRSTSALSAQLKKLEAQTGTPIFRKQGRGLALTEAGETLLSYAHRLIELNDEALTAVRGTDLQGWVRLGLQEDFGETLLPAVLGRFARAHPKVRIEAHVARSEELRERLALRQLDLALVWDAGPLQTSAPWPHVEEVAQTALYWIDTARPQDCPAHWRNTPGIRDVACEPALQQPLPLVLLDAPCPLRDITTEALARLGMPWRHVFTSASLAALWAATAAGLGLTVRPRCGMPSSVRVLEPGAFGLPVLPPVMLSLYRAQADVGAVAEQLARLLLDAVHQRIRGEFQGLDLHHAHGG